MNPDENRTLQEMIEAGDEEGARAFIEQYQILWAQLEQDSESELSDLFE